MLNLPSAPLFETTDGCDALVVVVALQRVECRPVADSCLINTIKENRKTATGWISQ